MQDSPASHTTGHGLDIVGVLGQIVGLSAMLCILMLHVLQLFLVGQYVILHGECCRL